MKNTLYTIVVISLFLTACAPSQKVTSYWVNKEALPKEPFKAIYFLAITQNTTTQPIIENMMADLLVSRGRKVVLNSELYPPSFSATSQLSREQLIDNITRTGCDGVLTLAVLDTKTRETYHQGASYAPMNYGHYGSYFGYYNYYYPIVYSPSYYTTDKTYYLETNFFDVKTDKLLWSIHSEAYNPSDLENFFKGYSKVIIDKLRTEGLIGK
jgi:hypothetical protein